MLTLVAVIFVFGLLIIGHEFGHFITAKLSGVKVLEFAFGMGPRLLKFGRGETEYSIRAFPIGGFVKMLGEEESIDDPRSFSTKPAGAKAAIIAAGPIMNMLISVMIFAAIAITVGYMKPVVSSYYRNPETPAVQYPAEKAGIEKGDRIVAVNNKKILTYDDFRMFMYDNGGKSFALTVERNGQLKNVVITPVKDTDGSYLIGIMASYGRAGVIEGIKYGFLSTISYAKQILGFLKSLVVGKASTGDVSGPVGIVKITGDAARQGFGSLLLFTAYLSINLGIMNLIPFPALDGGWLIIILIEAARRKKIDPDKIGVVNFIGFAFLMAIMILITFRDVSRLNIFR